MAVLVTTHIPDGTKEEAERWRGMMEPKLRKAPGFIFHVDHAVDGGYQLISSWESLNDFQRYFETEVKPLLPAGQADNPSTVVELGNVITR